MRYGKIEAVKVTSITPLAGAFGGGEVVEPSSLVVTPVSSWEPWERTVDVGAEDFLGPS